MSFEEALDHAFGKERQFDDSEFRKDEMSEWQKIGIFNQPLESKSENQEDPDKIAALFSNHQGGNDVNYEAAFQKA